VAFVVPAPRSSNCAKTDLDCNKVVVSLLLLALVFDEKMSKKITAATNTIIMPVLTLTLRGPDDDTISRNRMLLIIRILCLLGILQL
jgi:hypothetical protein